MFLTFNGQLETSERLVPLAGDPVETTARRVELPRLDFPQPLAADTNVADETGSRQDVEMLGDRLARDLGAGGQAGDGQGAAGAQARQQVSFVPSAALDDGALRSLPGVGDVSSHGERVTVSGTGDLVGVLMTELARRRVVPMQTRVQQSSLDDAFVAMTDDEEQR